MMIIQIRLNIFSVEIFIAWLRQGEDWASTAIVSHWPYRWQGVNLMPSMWNKWGKLIYVVKGFQSQTKQDQTT